MFRILTLVILIFLGNALAGTQEIDPTSLSKPFSNIPGTPRIAANEIAHEWLVAWRQGTPGKIMGRIVTSAGSLKPPRALITGIDSSSYGLDVAFDSGSTKYLVAFETKQGLEVQLLDQNLGKQGAPLFIESGIAESHVRVAFDPTRNHFLIFWLGNEDGKTSNILKIALLDPWTNSITQQAVVARAGQGNVFDTLSVARNPKNGSFLILTQEITSASRSSVIGYFIRANGTLVRQKPTLFQGFTPTLNTIPHASFADSGKGFVLWTDATSMKARKVSEQGKTASAIKTIYTANGTVSPQPAIAFDPQNGDFIALWAEQKKIRGARLNSSAGTTTEEFDVAQSILNTTMHIALSHNAGAGDFLAVWEDANGSNPGIPSSKFRVRGGLLKGNGGEPDAIISGEIRAYVPAEVTIRVGGTVKWVNNTGGHVITVTSGTPSNPTGLFDETLLNNRSFQYRFTQTGSFPYFCKHAWDEMKGVVTVIP